MVRRRTRARELAIQILYQIDITKEDYSQALTNFWLRQDEVIEDEVKNYTRELVKGVLENLGVIDDKIIQYTTNWQLERIAVVDRNILRLASFELIYRSDIPVKVAINEAIELAKEYSGLEAGKFVNGILDKVKLERKGTANENS